MVTPIDDILVNEGASPDILEIANHFDDTDIATHLTMSVTLSLG